MNTTPEPEGPYDHSPAEPTPTSVDVAARLSVLLSEADSGGMGGGDRLDAAMQVVASAWEEALHHVQGHLPADVLRAAMADNPYPVTTSDTCRVEISRLRLRLRTRAARRG